MPLRSDGKQGARLRSHYIPTAVQRAQTQRTQAVRVARGIHRVAGQNHQAIRALGHLHEGADALLPAIVRI